MFSESALRGMTDLPGPTLTLTRRDVQRLATMGDYIDSMSHVFRQHSDGMTIYPTVMGSHVHRGGFHAKAAGVLGRGPHERPMYAAKVNANFPGNPTERGLPTIQGVLLLFDAEDGQPLAVIDSIEITIMRTAAATAVAARYLARDDASTVVICGCGEQGRSQLTALTHVRKIRRAFAFDRDPARAEQYAEALARELAIEVVPVRELGDATLGADIWVTCTPARRWFVGPEHVAPGAFVAAVGADNPEKQEIAPALLASSTVVADILDQCAVIGDLHHALEEGVMRREDVHAELADVVSGKRRGRAGDDETIVFDSTGTAIQDVAAAKMVYERAIAAGVGIPVDFGSVAATPNADPGGVR